MFESTTIIDSGLGGAEKGAEALLRRQFGWAELVARLAATRDVRSVLAGANTGRVNAGQGGSFLAAETLLDQKTASSKSNNESAVNRVGLTDGKASAPMCAEAAADAAEVDREAQ